MAKCKICGRFTKYKNKLCSFCYHKIKNQNKRRKKKSSPLEYFAVFLILIIAAFLVVNSTDSILEKRQEVKYELNDSESLASKYLEKQKQEIIEQKQREETKIHEIEQFVFQQTNQLRNNPLRWNDDLAELARNHSKDMAERNFFDHVNPDGLDPSGRATKAGLSPYVGENISFIPEGNVVGCGSVYSADEVADCAMIGWVESSGHYSNMVNTSYTQIGVGVAYGNGNYYLTQNFR